MSTVKTEQEEASILGGGSGRDAGLWWLQFPKETRIDALGDKDGTEAGRS